MRAFLILSVLLCQVPAAQAHPGPTAPTFSPEEVRATVTFLADDMLEGRDAGTRGYDIAARYVATRFAALGLRPGGSDGSWYQQVPLFRYELDLAKPGWVDIGGRKFIHGEGALLSASPRHDGTQTISGDVVFVGYGFDSDYAKVDVRGKIVIALVGWPKDFKGEGQGPNKQRTAAAHGAIGMLRLVSPAEIAGSFSWADMTGYYQRARTRSRDTREAPTGGDRDVEIGGYLNPGAASALFAGSPMTAEQVFAAAAKPGTITGFALKPRITIERSSVISSTPSPNVVGLLAGSDPRLAAEYVVLSAHLDHLGRDPTLAGDQTYNGAMDNAVGVATMIEAARAFKQSGKSPRRSVLFVALTGEEDGLLGSNYLARHPVVGSGKVVADVNLDMPVLLYDFQDVVAFGAEHSTLGPIVEAAARKMDLTVSPDPMPEQRLFLRSDHYSFVEQGVPSVFLLPGFRNGGERAFKDFLANHYHTVSDQVTLPFNWEAGARFAKINYMIAREIADRVQAPRWYEGDEFGSRYAKNAPKAGAITEHK